MTTQPDKRNPPTGGSSTAPPKTSRVADPELQAMAKLDAILADLSEASVGRVIAWLVSRYTPSQEKNGL